MNSAMDRFLQWVHAREAAYAHHAATEAAGDINVVTQDDNMDSDLTNNAASSTVASAAAAMLTSDSQL